MKFPLGTDHLGRDILTRVLYGARISLMVGVGSVLISSTIGIFFGLISGFYGRWVDSFIMRVADIQLSFPPIFLCIALMAFIPPNLLTLILVLGVVTWVQFGRVSRGSTLSVKEKEYVEAARSLGTPNRKIIFRHILPNILSPDDYSIGGDRTKFNQRLVTDSLRRSSNKPSASGSNQITTVFILIGRCRRHFSTFLFELVGNAGYHFRRQIARGYMFKKRRKLFWIDHRHPVCRGTFYNPSGQSHQRSDRHFFANSTANPV